jgi:hypothetical protein
MRPIRYARSLSPILGAFLVQTTAAVGGHPEIAVQGGIDRQAIEPPFSATTRWTWNLPRRKGRGIIERGMRESQPTPSMQG